MKVEEDEDLVTGINVTPLVDVCLVLVIIFMVTAPLMSDPVIKVALPTARTQEGDEKDKLTLTIASDGRLALNQKEYSSYESLEPDLKLGLLMSESKQVILRADKDALHGRLTEIMAKSKDAGASSLTIATEKKR